MNNQGPKIPGMNQAKAKLLLEQAAARQEFEKCPCGCEDFTSVTRIKIVSGLIVGLPGVFTTNYGFLACKKCGELFKGKGVEDEPKVSAD